MKKLAAALALSALAFAAPTDRTVWDTLKPSGSPKSVKLVLLGKPATYYVFDGEGAGVRLQGPTRLRVSVRPHFGKEDGSSVEILLSIAMDGGEARVEKLTAKRSKTALYSEGAEGEAPGERVEKIVDVPEGEHTFTAKTDVRASGSFSIPSTKKKILRTEMTPATFSKAVNEVYQERERTWYFGTQDKPVELELTGPTTLRVYAALNFDASMRASTDWKFEADVDGTAVLEKSYKSSKSHTRSYPDDKDVVPGQMETLEVKVPEGRHKIELKPRGTHSAAFRVQIPTSDLKKSGPK